ncbi:FeoC-like transcriptional regulator [Butyrivibrio sp. DSM 10294]|uniref:FeoC-like transcriptional regulator n=1 Tax=Butyrivibrio sp. DSM 10294 TaxID=2972457 RepID=UPI00234EA023|nr:FeoC-like transcriptional regulator [Butyrivibrio sp. DSM 10294]MDC7292026.1 FeoC-like transcriptional regulator [Butyrivibrio sp. DSM 10294]
MRELIDLLSDGHARTEKLLAIELHTTEEDVKRQIEYLMHIGMIRKVDMTCCSGGCGGDCGKCAPKEGFKNMGAMYEVVL